MRHHSSREDSADEFAEDEEPGAKVENWSKLFFLTSGAFTASGDNTVEDLGATKTIWQS